MSDIQELIHKTSMDCIEKGQKMEQERIIKLLEDIVVDWRKNDLNNQADTFDYAIALIKGEN